MDCNFILRVLIHAVFEDFLYSRQTMLTIYCKSFLISRRMRNPNGTNRLWGSFSTLAESEES